MGSKRPNLYLLRPLITNLVTRLWVYNPTYHRLIASQVQRAAKEATLALEPQLAPHISALSAHRLRPHEYDARAGEGGVG